MLNNPLDCLFRDIRKELWLEEQQRNRAAKPLTPKPKPQSTYANPENWTPGRIITLIHHLEGPIGEFQEYFHKLSPGTRRLMPAAAGAAPSASEIVFGDYWLHPQFATPAFHYVEDSREIALIEARFAELIQDLDEEDFA